MSKPGPQDQDQLTCQKRRRQSPALQACARCQRQPRPMPFQGPEALSPWASTGATQRSAADGNGDENKPAVPEPSTSVGSTQAPCHSAPSAGGDAPACWCLAHNSGEVAVTLTTKGPHGDR